MFLVAHRDDDLADKLNELANNVVDQMGYAGIFEAHISPEPLTDGIAVVEIVIEWSNPFGDVH